MDIRVGVFEEIGQVLMHDLLRCHLLVLSLTDGLVDIGAQGLGLLHQLLLVIEIFTGPTVVISMWCDQG